MKNPMILCAAFFVLAGCSSQDSVGAEQEEPYIWVCSYEDVVIAQGSPQLGEPVQLLSPDPPNAQVVGEVLRQAGIMDYIEEGSVGISVGVRASEYQPALYALSASEELHGRDIWLHIYTTTRPEAVSIESDSLSISRQGEKPTAFLWDLRVHE